MKDTVGTLLLGGKTRAELSAPDASARPDRAVAATQGQQRIVVRLSKQPDQPVEPPFATAAS